MRDSICKVRTVGGFRLVARLGGGFSGEVWSAIDSVSGEVVALKICRERDDAMRCAEYEYAIARQFVHSNILRPSGMFVFEGRPVIVLPYCSGRSVDGVAGYMPELQMWHMMRDVSAALSAVHRAGYCHFDIKPSNILWTGREFMVADFGSCRPAGQENREPTADDESSFRYAAPEVVRRRFDTSGDVWSLGATAFYLYMGTHVFNGLGGRAQHPDSPLPYMRKSLEELSRLTCRCLAYEASARPSAAEIAEISERNIERCKETVHMRPMRPGRQSRDGMADAEDFWPETMDDSRQ